MEVNPRILWKNLLPISDNVGLCAILVGRSVAERVALDFQNLAGVFVQVCRRLGDELAGEIGVPFSLPISRGAGGT